MDRRVFIQSAVIVAAAPALANLMSLETWAQSNAAEVARRPPAEPNLRPVELRIQGWSVNCFAVPPRETISAMDLMSSNAEIDEVVIGVNRAWRAAWR
jgi:hypothetical protein